jgi:hypothetical protein
MDPFRMFASSMHELLGITILALHGIYDEVSPSPPTSMHPRRIAIPPSQELGMTKVKVKVGGEGDTLSYIP